VTEEPQARSAPVGARRRGGEALGGALVALSSLAFGTVVLFGKFALRVDLPVFTILSVRFGLATLLLLSLLAALRRPLRPVAGERLGIVVVGMAGYGIEAVFFFSGLRYGTAAAVTLLFFTFPVFVTLTSWAIGRGRPSRPTLAALALAIVGAALIVTAGGNVAVQTLGVVLALASALTYTAYLLGADHVLKRTNALTAAMWQAGSASVGLGLVALSRGELGLPRDADAWWPILGMSLATAAAFFCLLEGLRRLGAVRTAIIGSLEPFAVAVLGTLFLDEPLGVVVVVGGLLIVVGAVAAALARTTPVPEPPV